MSVADFSTKPRRQRPGAADLVLGSVAGLVLLASAASAFESWSGLRRAQAALERTREDLASARAQARSLRPRSAADGTLASRILLSRDAPPQTVMERLAALLPPDVRLEDARLSYDDRLTLELRVRARDAAAYDLFLQRLSASPAFAGIVPGEEARGRELSAVLRLWHRDGDRP
jgi:hypothetical protein